MFVNSSILNNLAITTFYDIVSLDIFFSFLVPNPCHPDGNVKWNTNVTGSYKCVCNLGFEGENCELGNNFQMASIVSCIHTFHNFDLHHLYAFIL